MDVGSVEEKQRRPALGRRDKEEGRNNQSLNSRVPVVRGTQDIDKRKGDGCVTKRFYFKQILKFLVCSSGLFYVF